LKRIAIGTVALLLCACAPSATPTPEPTVTPLPPTDTLVPNLEPIDFGKVIFNPRDWDISDFADLTPTGNLLQGIHVEIKEPLSPLSEGRIDVHVYATPDDAVVQFDKWVSEDVSGLDSYATSTTDLGNPIVVGISTIPAGGGLPATAVATYVVQVCRGVINYSLSMSGTPTDFTPSIAKTEQALAEFTCP